jgi:hypothetical protein
MVLLIQTGLRDREASKMLKHVFKHRATHELPTSIEKPPTSWAAPFQNLAGECGVTLPINEAHDLVRTFFEKVCKADTQE